MLRIRTIRRQIPSIAAELISLTASQSLRLVPCNECFTIALKRFPKERNRHRFTRTVEGVSCDLCGRYVKGIHLTEMSWIEAERARCRRPINADEVVGLEALGGELRRLRREVAGISRGRLGVLAEVSSRQLEQIERGIRRTRRSTLERIAEALVQLKPGMGEPAALARRLAALAGAGLAPESIYRARVDKRRKARNAKLRRRVMYRYIIPMLHARLDAELRAERREIKALERSA